jgi:hypothetical protein
MSSIPVKNIGRGPLYVDGAGFIPSGDTGDAEDSDHTAALIESGALLRMPDPETPAERRAREKAEAEAAKATTLSSGEQE